MWYIFVVAVFNLGLGFALAVALKHFHVRRYDIVADGAPPVDDSMDQINETDAATTEAPPAEAPSSTELPPEQSASEEIPEEWLNLLDELGEGDQAGSFIEASVQVLRLEVGKYRDALVRIDGRSSCCEQPR